MRTAATVGVIGLTDVAIMSRLRRSKSAAWRRRQESDTHVLAARAAGYRSRSAYKLLEIDNSHRLLRQKMRVADLGGSPGGWSQVLRQRVGQNGYVVAVDLLPMEVLEGVHFILGDFTEPAIQQQITAALGGAADVVVSDMAPNLSGIAVRDQANATALSASALAYCQAGGLKKGGDFLIKTFAGEEQGEYRQLLIKAFGSVKVIYPQATRKNSRECYLLAKSFKLTPHPTGEES